MVGTEANKNAIQALPIHRGTKSAIHTNEPIGIYKVLHCKVDGNVTYTFTDDTTFAEALITGEDRALSSDIK